MYIRALIGGANFINFVKSPPETEPHDGGMPVAILPKTQAGIGSRLLLIKAAVARKQKKNHPEIKPADYLQISEVLGNPDGAIREKNTADSASVCRWRIHRKIRGYFWLVVWDEQKDGRCVLVSFFATGKKTYLKSFLKKK